MLTRSAPHASKPRRRLASLVTAAVCSAAVAMPSVAAAGTGMPFAGPAAGGTGPSSTAATPHGAAAAADPLAAASLQARVSGKAVAVGALTTETSTTTANADGTYTVATDTEPARTKDAAGHWVALDPTLRRAADGTLSPVATADSLTLSGGGSGPVIRVADHAGHAMALSLPVALPAPALNGASATYAEIYPGIDLTVTVDREGGFSEVFTVHDAAAAARAAHLSFQTSLTGLRLQADPGGKLHAVDSVTGAAIMSAPTAAMWDSATATAPRTAGADTDPLATDAPVSSASGPGRRAHSAALKATPTATGIALDSDFSRLSSASGSGSGSAAPAYPLYVDPTWSAPSTSPGILDSDEVQSGCSGTSNYNTITDLGVGYNEFSGCIGIERSLLLLSLSGLSKSTHVLTSDFKITSDYSAYDSCGQATYTVALAWTGPFGSSTDYGNQPARDSNASVPNPMSTRSVKTNGNSLGTQCGGGVPVDFSITGPISYFASQGVGSLSVGLYGYESASSSLERFNRSTAVLVTTYDLTPGTPSALTASPTPVLTGGTAAPCGSTSAPGWLGITNLGGKTVATLSAKAASSVAAAEMYGIYSITDATTGVKTTTNSSGYVKNGGTVSVNTPTLADGNEYDWSLHTSDQYLSSAQTGTCAFRVDKTAPDDPATTSASFPSLDSGQTPTLTTGQAGSLTLASTDPAPAAGTASGLRGFDYSFDTPVPASGATFAAATSGSATLSFTTPQWGVHTLYSQATDNAGNVSAQSAYSFYVPWNPAAKVSAGDVSGDGVPDLVATDSGGNLVEYAGNAGPGAAAVPLAAPATSPDGTSPWSAYLYTHNGSFTNGAVDDLWAYDTANHNLYLDKNSRSATGGNFADPADVVNVTKAGVLSDEENDSSAGDASTTTACFTTSTGSCAGYDDTDWSTVTQVVAPGDLYAGDPVAGIDNGAPGLLTVENGALWYYQGQTMQDFVGTAIQLGTSGWDGVTVLGPGVVGGQHVIWTRDASGTLRQYPITFDAAGYPVNLGTPTGASGTVLSVPAGVTPTGTQVTAIPGAQYPAVYTADLHGTGQPDVIAVTGDGIVDDWAGGAASSGLATFGDPQAIGDTGTASGSITVAEGQTLHANGAAWSNAKTTVRLDDGVLSLTDTATGTVLKTFGTGGNPAAYLVLGTDGNLAVYSKATGGTVTWSAGTSGTGESLQLLATGNLVVVSSAGLVVWQSLTAH
ncbi:hypothetical protein ABIA31_005587 [Catenulispora sp. MAP5-51]